MMKKLFSRTIFGLSTVALILLSACQIKPTQPPLQESFDTDPGTVILYLDIRYPGIPMPTNVNGVQRCIPYPVFRVWGDNFALLNTDDSRIQRDQIDTGFLSLTTRTALYNLLLDDRFFSINPEASPPNPAGTYMSMGAKLKNHPVVGHSGDIGFLHYSAYVDLIKPDVTPVAEQTTLDARVDAFIQYSNCPTYEK